jgi:hypothetical protein
VEHGTRSRYRHYGCRCAKCKKAQRDYMRTLVGKKPPNHGASGYLNYRCRCEICKAAYVQVQAKRTEYKREWARRKAAG